MKDIVGDWVGEQVWVTLRLFLGVRMKGKLSKVDESGVLRIEVVKGRVSVDDPLADYHVDGVSGATLTGNGVTKTMQYWLGDHGYGPYLRNIHGEGT